VVLVAPSVALLKALEMEEFLVAACVAAGGDAEEGDVGEGGEGGEGGVLDL